MLLILNQFHCPFPHIIELVLGKGWRDSREKFR